MASSSSPTQQSKSNRVTTVKAETSQSTSPERLTANRCGFGLDSITCGSNNSTKSTFNNMNPESTHSKVISHVFFTGSAKQGTPGPPIGLVDIGESEIAYLFRVSLPGINKNLNKIKCEIQREGRVCIQGVAPEIAIPSDSGCLYRMQVQQLCPPGPFSITFNLPGQVDPRLFSPKFRPDGIFEVVVVKLGVRVPQS